MVPRSDVNSIEVLIEHENQWADKLATRRLWKKSGKVAPDALRILITYTDTTHHLRHPRNWSVIRDAVLAGLGSSKPSRAGFLVCLGPEDWAAGTKWAAYTWAGRGKFRPL